MVEQHCENLCTCGGNIIVLGKEMESYGESCTHAEIDKQQLELLDRCCHCIYLFVLHVILQVELTSTLTQQTDKEHQHFIATKKELEGSNEEKKVRYFIINDLPM